MFKDGDRVRIVLNKSTEPAWRFGWNGVTGIVDGARSLKDNTYVKPDYQRPDDNGWCGFFWETSQLELVDEGGEVGDKVCSVTDGAVGTAKQLHVDMVSVSWPNDEDDDAREPWPLKMGEDFVMTDRLQGEQFNTGDVAMVMSPKIDQFGGVWITVKDQGMRVHWSRLHTPAVGHIQNWAVVLTGVSADKFTYVNIHQPSFEMLNITNYVHEGHLADGGVIPHTSGLYSANFIIPAAAEPVGAEKKFTCNRGVWVEDGSHAEYTTCIVCGTVFPSGSRKTTCDGFDVHIGLFDA